MANDPMAIVSVTSVNLGPGAVMHTILTTGPADYDATGGSVFDLSSYVTAIKFIGAGACTIKGHNLVIPRYVSANFATGAATGAVYFTWDGANDGGVQAARVLENVADTTDLHLYSFQWVVIGTPPTR